MIKTTQELEIKGNVLNLMKSIVLKKPTGNIIVDSWWLKMFPFRSGKRQGYRFSTLLINIILKTSATAIKKEKDIKSIQNGRVVKLLICNGIIFYVENSKDFTKKTTKTNKFTKVAGYKNRHTKNTCISIYSRLTQKPSVATITLKIKSKVFTKAPSNISKLISFSSLPLSTLLHPHWLLCYFPIN